MREFGLTSALETLPELVQEDDIVRKLVEDVRHLQTEIDLKSDKLRLRISHLHQDENQEYGW